MYVFHASAAVLLISIPSSTGFVVLKMSRILVYAFLASYLFSERLSEFQEVLVVSLIGDFVGLLIVSSRYPVVSLSTAIERIVMTR